MTYYIPSRIQALIPQNFEVLLLQTEPIRSKLTSENRYNFVARFWTIWILHCKILIENAAPEIMLSVVIASLHPFHHHCPGHQNTPVAVYYSIFRDWSVSFVYIQHHTFYRLPPSTTPLHLPARISIQRIHHRVGLGLSFSMMNIYCRCQSLYKHLNQSPYSRIVRADSAELCGGT